MVSYHVGSEALLYHIVVQFVIKLSVPQKKPKFLVVKEELTKHIRSMGISRFCPQIRYECTVCFHFKNLSLAKLKNAFLNTGKNESQTGNCDSSIQGCSKCICGSPLRYLPSFKQRLSSYKPYIYALIVMSKIALYALFLFLFLRFTVPF